jgi:linoleate 10R-lipoxygenase
LRSKARKAVDDLLPSIQRHLTSIAKGFVRSWLSSPFIELTMTQGSIASLKDIATHLTTTRNDHSGTFLANIVAASPNRDPQTTAVGVVAEIVASAAMWSAALVHAVDFYLDDAHAEQRQAIITHCADQSAAADAALLGYIYEAMSRLPL